MLDRNAPDKKKELRADSKPYVTKAMWKAIIKRSELATKYLARPNEENQKAFKNQRNFCNRLYKKEQRKYYDNLDLRKITGKRKFWNTVKPFLSTNQHDLWCLIYEDRIKYVQHRDTEKRKTHCKMMRRKKCKGQDAFQHAEGKQHYESNKF